MSTGLECNFIEVAPGKWFYVLQDGNCPVQCWDWREYATAYGPFPTLDVAQAHLRKWHANPGGYSTEEYSADYKPDEVMAGLIATARR